MSGPKHDRAHDSLIDPICRRIERIRRAQREGPPSLGRQMGQIGVLGWIIVTPMLIGLFIGRWLDHHFGTGIFWSAPLLILGTVLGCWSAWRWMHEP
jgi:ATP synthase protein I